MGEQKQNLADLTPEQIQAREFAIKMNKLTVEFKKTVLKFAEKNDIADDIVLKMSLQFATNLAMVLNNCKPHDEVVPYLDIFGAKRVAYVTITDSEVKSGV